VTFHLDQRKRVLLVLVLGIGSAVAAWLSTPRRTAARREGGPLVIALAGDAAVSMPLDFTDPGLQGVSALLHRVSLAVANFEASAPAAPIPDEPEGPPRWPFAVPEAAAHLRQLGIGAVSLANNHAFDFGADGLRAVQERLAASGIAHAGAGENLDAARQPAYVETPQGTVALIAVAVSHAPGARATPRKGDINGRPGVNPLRYSRRLTVDAPSFAALRKAFPPDVLRADPGGATWNLFGVTIEQGDQSAMTLVADPDDLASLAASVQAARGRAVAVVVSLHAHEPGNRIDDVPDLLRAIARGAIDAGADAVSGHGPHRLRGVEIYRAKPIFYSLGNLVFADRAIPPQAADEFENMARNVLSPFADDSEGPQVDFTGDVWWQSAIALVHFSRGHVARVELHPVDVGVGHSPTTRGTPRLAQPDAAAQILDRLQMLSAPLGTTIAVEHGTGIVKE